MPTELGRGARVGYGLVLVASMALIGGFAGGTIAALTSPHSALDGQIDTLGGLMMGLLAGAIVGALLAWKADAARLRMATALSFALSVALIVFAAWRIQTREKEEAEDPPPPPPQQTTVPPIPPGD